MAVDVETTGINPAVDRIIEIGIVVFGRDGVVDRWETKVDPDRPLPLEIQRLTGITAEDLVGAPAIESLRLDIRRRIGSLPLVGHNISFDTSMLAAAGIVLPNRAYDTYRLAQLLLPNLRGYGLTAVAAALAIDTAVEHRAIADTERAVEVFRVLLARLDDFDERTLSRAAIFAQQAGWAEAALFRSAAERNLAGPLFGRGDGHDLLPELRFSEPRERPESLQRTGSTASLDPDAIDTLLSDHGPLPNVLERYESRPQQSRMAVAVARALNDDNELLVEAGTGTGKSLAYLLPAALHALERGERVVVSTDTLALQDQLYGKDLPDVRTALRGFGIEETLRVAVMKGRNNYLCLRRWFDHIDDPVENAADAALRAKILLWLPYTQTGDRAELRLTLDEEPHWRKFASERGRCSPKRCTYARVNQCFLYRARHLAANAHVVIANHSLVLSNRSQGYVLPTFERLVIDEAHHLEEEATDQFTWSVSRASLDDPTRSLINADGAAPAGFYAITESFLARLSDESAIKNARQAKERVASAVQQGMSVSALGGELMTRLGGLLPPPRRGNQYFPDRLRITDAVRYRGGWSDITLLWRQLDGTLLEFIDTGRWLMQVLDSLGLPDDDAHPESILRDDLTIELQSVLEELITVRSQLMGAFGGEGDGLILWVERSNQGNATGSLHGAPLDVSELLRTEVFDELKSCILTSATLTIDGSFGYMVDRLGLADALTVPLGSPFDHEQSTVIYLPDDMPEPNAANYQAAVNETLIELLRATEGRALVLFTSNASLQATHRAIRGPLEKDNISVLGQRIDGSFRQLVDRLRTNPGTVLLGTSSFWEGVDVVGDALSLVVIVKLPFPVPSDPIFEARSELCADPFLDMSIPHAILRFKQGFGRLIRSKSDRGVCVVLDRRIVSRRYGQSFLHSLPPSRVVIGSAYDVPDRSRAWLAGDTEQRASVFAHEGEPW